MHGENWTKCFRQLSTFNALSLQMGLNDAWHKKNHVCVYVYTRMLFIIIIIIMPYIIQTHLQT